MSNLKELNSLSLYSLFKGKLKERELLPEEEELLNIADAIKFKIDDKMDSLMAIDVIDGVITIYYQKRVLAFENQILRNLIMHELSHVLRGDTLEDVSNLVTNGLKDDIKNYFNQSLLGVIEDHIINKSLYVLSKKDYKFLYKNGIILKKGKSIIDWSVKKTVDYLSAFLEKEINRQGGKHIKDIVTDILKVNSKEYITFNPPKNNDSSSSSYDDSSDSSVNPIKKTDEISLDLFEEQLKELVMGNSNLSEGSLNSIGSTGIDFESLAEVAEPIDINWESVLSNSLSNIISFIEKDESWAYPNFFDDNEIGEVWESLPIINLVVDTSGSMYTQEILDSIVEIISGLGDMTVRVIQIDVDVKVDKIMILDTDELKRDGLLMSGGGGTELSPAFAYIHEQNWDKDPTIVITDGEIEAGDYRPLLDNRYWVVINGTTKMLPKDEDYEEVTI